MKKFFLFKRKEVNVSSITSSDSGEGLDILAVPVDQVAYITAELGRVVIVFNNATAYEENSLLDGESFKKTSVSVACEQGGEAALIESIMSFISSDKNKTNVMRFDAVGGRTNVSGTDITSFLDVVSELRDQPVTRNTKEVSANTFIGGTSGTAFGTGNTIGGINFGPGNKPAIDFTEASLTESGGNVNGWTNSGSEGSTYNISSVTGTIPLDTSTGRSNNGLATQAADFGSNDNLALPSNYVASGDFTLFAVVGRSVTDIDDNPKLGFLFQGSATSGQGLTLGFADAYDNNNYQFKFSSEKGEFVVAESDRHIIESHLDSSIRKTAYVFVLRRQV